MVIFGGKLPHYAMISDIRSRTDILQKISQPVLSLDVRISDGEEEFVGRNELAAVVVP